MIASHCFATGTCNKDLEFWNLVDTYPRGIIRCTESWLTEETGNTEIFRADFTTFSRDSMPMVGVKNIIACSELWVDEELEILTVEVKSSDLNVCGNCRQLQSHK